MKFLTPLKLELLGKLDKQSRLPRFKLLEPLVLELSHNSAIVAPEGFVTDLASIPWFLHWLFTPWDCVARRPAVIHDRLYKNQGPLPFPYLYKRKACDILLYRTILLEHGSILRALAYYYAVRLFGKKAFKSSRTLTSHK